MTEYIKGVRLINWRCYRGTQEVDLEPTVYSIVAEEEGNPERSNWLGKSSFGAAIRFALTGELDKNERADGWITEGESEGGVELELSDGTFVSRLRTRGSSTQLEVEVPASIAWEGSNKARILKKDQAQAYLDVITGGADFFNATAFFAQDKTDQLVQMQPAERTAIVSDWLALDQLSVAETWIGRKKLAPLEAETVTSAARVREWETTYKDQAALMMLLGDAEKRYEKFGEELDRARVRMADAKRANETHAAWQAAQRSVGRLSQLRKELANFAVPELPDPKKLTQLRVTRDEETGNLASAKRSLEQARSVAIGDFDGACPVADGFVCPVRDQINRQGDAAEQKVRTCEALVRQSERRKDDATKVLDAVTKENDRARDLARRRDEMKAEISRIEQEVKLYEGMKEPKTEDVIALSEEIEDLTARRLELSRELVTMRLVAEKWKEAETTLKEARLKLSVYRVAMSIVGRAGAQRVLAETALREIARDENRAFERAGVPLGVSVSWARELDRLETFCRECGWEYGKTQSAKSCPFCSAPRKAQLDYALQVELTAVSGGSKKLSGLMFQLSAGAYLRRHLQRGFGSLFIDEPFGSIDRANRVAIAARFASLLEQDFGVRQAFVVAHDVDTLDTLPARIRIVSQGGNSRISVA